MAATVKEATDFKVVTLNDLLEADARAGAAAGGAADDKYQKWFFVSAAAAGLFAVLFVVALLTGGGDDGGGCKASKTVAKPDGTTEVNLSASPSKVGGTLEAGDKLSVLTTGPDGSLVVLANGATVTSVSEEDLGGLKTYSFQLAVTDAEFPAVSTAESKQLKFSKGTVTVSTTATTAAPAAVPTPPTPEAPAPADQGTPPPSG